MAITTHAQLLTAVSDYIGKRADLGSVDDDFVVLCEARLNYGSFDPVVPTPPLRVRQMETRGTLSPTSEYTSLPSGFLQAQYAKVTSTSKHVSLKAMPQAMFDRRLSNNQIGTPCYYSIYGTELRINPVQSCTLELGYYTAIPALASNDPNWLLTANPALYLYGSLLEAALYIEQDEDIATYGRMFSGLVQSMNISGSDSARAHPLTVENPIRAVSGSIRA